MTKVQKNALTEVFEIINHLNDNDYNKIPREVVNAIRENRNTDYLYLIDESTSIDNQEISTEARAILFNLFRDYFATDKEKNKILNYQKKAKYNINKSNNEEHRNINTYFTKKRVSEELNKIGKEVNTKDLVKTVERKWYTKIFSYIKRIIYIK